MTDEEINEAIAKANGWTVTEKGWWYLEGWGYLPHPPDYCKDLNAMHEAEKILYNAPFNNGKPHTYFELLTRIDGDSWHATARQRAEALLKTLNLWRQ